MSENPRLILHFDVNKTLIMLDKVSNKSVEVICNQVIMENMFGIMKRPIQYILMGDTTPSVEEMNKIIKEGFELKYINTSIHLEEEEGFHVEKRDFVQETLELVSFKRFIGITFPFYKDLIRWNHPEKEEFLKMSKDDSRKFNRKSKKKRVDTAGLFLDLEIGKRFRPFQEILLKEMRSISPDYVIPSFFELMEYLRMKKYDFRIVFRTFGNDIEIVEEEFNKFCTGTHRRHPEGKWMKNKKLDLKKLTTIGHVFRTDENDRLIIGTMGPDVVGNEEESMRDSLSVLDSPRQIYDFFVNGDDDVTLSIRDHYFYWNLNGETSEFGKVLVIDPKDRNVLQIFFDDNMVLSGGIKGICDLQDLEGNHLPTKDFLGLYLHWVSPLKAVMNRDYYIKVVEESVKRFKNL